MARCSTPRRCRCARRRGPDTPPRSRLRWPPAARTCSPAAPTCTPSTAKGAMPCTWPAWATRVRPRWRRGCWNSASIPGSPTQPESVPSTMRRPEADGRWSRCWIRTTRCPPACWAATASPRWTARRWKCCANSLPRTGSRDSSRCCPCSRRPSSAPCWWKTGRPCIDARIECCCATGRPRRAGRSADSPCCACSAAHRRRPRRAGPAARGAGAARAAWPASSTPASARTRPRAGSNSSRSSWSAPAPTSPDPRPAAIPRPRSRSAWAGCTCSSGSSPMAPTSTAATATA